VVHPVKHKIQIPMINKAAAQVVSIQGEEVQLMDLSTYDMFTVPIPDEFRDDIEPGKDVQYLEALGKRKITRV